MAFDPNQPFEEVEEVGFDPNLPFELVEEPVGTSVEQEVSQLGAALKSGIAQPLQAMGVTAETLGMPAVGAALKGAVEQPEGYVPAAQRFMEPQAGEAQLGGFAFQYLPRAIVEQVGQLGGSIVSRAAGGIIGGAAGSVVPGAGTAVGAGIGMFTGPALFEAAQIVGPVAQERAKNNGREIPNSEDLAYAWTTAGTSGALNAIGTKYLPGGEKAVGALTKRIAASFLGESATEGAQALAQQAGETILTEKGLEIQPKAALGEALIGGVSAGGATIVMSPLQKEQVDIEKEADLESRDLSIPVDDPEVRANLDKAAILEQENKDSLAIINKFGVESEEGKAAQQTIVDNTDEITKINEALPASVSLPITTAEQQQIELAKQIAAPAEKEAKLPAMPSIEEQTSEAAYGRELGVYDVFGGVRRKPAPPVAEAPVITPAPAPEAAPQRLIRSATESGLKPIKPREVGALRGFYTFQAKDSGSKIAFSSGATIAEENPNELNIEAIYTPPKERGTGSASRLLNEILSIADKNNITLKLEPKGISDLAEEGDSFLTKKQLSSWYKRYGFKQEIEGSDDILVRTPSAPAPVTTPPVTEVVTPVTEAAPARLYLNVPFNRKEAAKSAGAKFDSEKKLWYIQRSPTGELPPIAPSFIKEIETTTFSAKELEPARINAESQLGQEVEIGSFETPTGTAYGLKVKGGDWLNKNINLEIERQRTKAEPISETADELYSRLAKNKEDEIRKEISEIKKGRKNPKSKWYGARDSEISKREREIGSLQFGDWGIVVDAFDAELAAKKPVSDVWNELFIKQRLSPNEFQARLDRAGYTKQGDLYVYQPATTPAEAAPEVAPARRLADLKIKPSTDDIQEVAAANDLTAGQENINVPANELKPLINLGDPKERKRVDQLKEKILSEDGFISRVIVDGKNNVVEGQHRVQAMKELGYDLIPAVQLKSADDFIPDSASLDKVMRDAGLASSDKRNQARQLIAEIINDEKGDVEKLREYEAPTGIEEAWNAAIEEVIRQNAPAAPVSETPAAPAPSKLRGEAGGVLIPSREDLIQAGQNIYEAGMEFGAWAKQMIQRFGDAVRQFLADVWEAVSGFPAKLEEMAGYLPGKGEGGAVTFGRGEEPPKKPAEPAPVTPTEPAPEKPAAKPAGRVEQIMSQKIGPSIKTQDGIIAKTKDKLKTLFDPEVVNEANTSTAYRAIGILSGTNRDAARQYAESINALTAEGLGEDADTANEISMGAALFVNNLFEYAVKLAAKGDRKMLGLMVSNINKLPTGQMGASDAGRTLRARVELKARFLMMAQAEQDAFTNYVAEFIYGPNPTEAQIKSIKDAYSATQKVTQPTTEELTEEIAKVGEKTNTDLVSKINDDFTKAAEKTADARDAELKELSDEYNKIQDKAETEIEKLAEIQSDTPSFARRVVNEIRAIVSADLKQKPDMGRKAPWKSMLIAKLQNAGVNPTNAETLADLVWRQHEINATSRELDSINKAIEKGPISEIIKQIKDTPIEQQQAPDWRYKVMRDYLRKAGLSMAQAERVAKLMDISLQKRFTEAKEKAFTESIEKSAPWKSGDARSKRAFQQVIKAIRAGALDPSRNFLNDVAAANGWTGFTDSQYAKLIKLDSILSNPKSSDADKAEAHKAIQNIISNSKLPIRARDVIGQFYDAQALSGIPTITVNMVSPIGMAAKNALVQAASGIATFRPDQIDAAFRTLMDSIKSWVNTVAYSFKNNVTVYSNVEYLVNDEGLLKLYNRGKEQFKKGKTPKDRADGVKNMMVGMWDYVRRILNALDYGAIASLQNQTVPKYALAAMQAKGMSSKDGTKMLNAMFEAKRNFYEQQIAAGVDKNKASVLADEFFVSSWRQALTDAKLPAQQVIDSAINDAMSAVGRTRASLDNFRDENTNLQDAGVTSMPALWLLQSMANAANKSDSQIVKIFARIIYGFAVVPARVFRETAWFSPYGYVRFAYDAIAKKKGLNSPYAQSLGNDLQYRQRINEATAGTLVMLGLASALVSSIDDEDDERPFKIVVTGNGPNRADDPQFYDSWIKNNTPNSVRIQFGKTKFTINTMRGFEAFAWPAMMLGAVDDWQIRRKMNRKQNEPVAVGDAAIVAGNVFSAALKRGPYAFAAKPLFESYGDRTVESLFKSLAFPVKTLIPGVGSSLARNFSDLLNEPIDRRTLDGALWANVPFIGPAVAPKAMNAFGEPALAGEASDKLFKLGVPIVFKIGTDRDSVNIHNLVLKQGSGPSIPTRNQLAKRLDREPTNKEYELFVKEYGSFISEQMKKRYKRYDEMKPETYDKAIQKLSDVARDRAERVVRRQKKP